MPSSHFSWLEELRKICWGGKGAYRQAGLVACALSSLAYAIMNLLVKVLAEKEIPVFETVCFRSFIIVVCAAAQMLATGVPWQAMLGQRRLWTWMVARSMVGFVALSGFFVSIALMPLKDAATIHFMAPVFTSLLANVFLRELWGVREMAAMGICFLGVVFISRPPFLARVRLLGLDFQSVADAGVEEHSGKFRWGVAAAVVAAAAAGAAYTILRYIGQQGEKPEVTVLWFAAISVLLSMLMMLGMREAVVLPDLKDLPAMTAIGLLAYVAQVMLTRGLQIEKAARGSSMQFLKLLVTYLLGVFCLGEAPTVPGMLGAFFIVVGAMYMSTDPTVGADASQDEESARRMC